MLKNKTFLILLISLFIISVSVQLLEAGEHTIMRPDTETRLEWIASAESAPRAYINPALKALRGSKNLLSHLQYTPSERNQVNCGNCWAWAGTGCLGIALDVQQGIKKRLSMQYLNSCNGTGDDYACCGGWLEDFADFYASAGQTIPWANTNAHWQDGSKQCPDGSSDVSCASISTTPNYPISSVSDTTITTHGVGQATAINNIKNVLDQNKAVWFGFFLCNSADWQVFFDFWDDDNETELFNFDYSCNKPWNQYESGGHAVLCVGYNDNVPGNIYWIMLNSWGTTAGRPNGLFRVDMDIDYDCQDTNSEYNLYWQTLNVSFSVLTPTPTPVGYHTATPTPSVTPTPEGYKTATPTPTPTVTPTVAPQTIPFTEDFEGPWSGGAPAGWSKEYVTGTTDWLQGIGCDWPGGKPPAAHSGTYNALIYYDDSITKVTRLITPRLDFGDKTNNTTLTFWHAQGDWDGDYDTLKVYYKSSYGGAWTLLKQYTSAVDTWTQRTISLPNPSDDYYICFKGTTNYGWGVCVDDVLITGEAPPPPTQERFVIDSGDYDGDGTSDIAVFRESSGLWSVRGITRVYFGTAGDEPVPGDYDGNGTTDIGIFRETSAFWVIRNITRAYFGSALDLPIPGDFDGDSSCDLGVFRETSALWAIRNVTRIYFGSPADSPVPGYYQGANTKDIAIFRNSTGLWVIRNFSRFYFGTSGDLAGTGDFDGDSTIDVGIFRPTSALWVVRGITRMYFGKSGDQAVPADYDGNSTDDVGIFRGTSGLWVVKGITRLYYGSSSDIPVTR